MIFQTFKHCYLSNILQYDFFRHLNFNKTVIYRTTGISVVVAAHIFLLRVPSASLKRPSLSLAPILRA